MNAGRQCRSRSRPASIAFTASPSEASGARLNETSTTGNCPWWLTASGAVSCLDVRERAQRNHLPAVGEWT